MAAKTKQEAQNPLILRCHRLIDAFAKSDDERDFFIDRMEGFIIYVDLDKPTEELNAFQKELANDPDRYCLIPKLSFYETKKIMEGFVNEKVYDIDTKEKLLDIIQSKEARENFLEFIYDHHSEQEKWQQFYQERSRIRIIEWLRVNHFHFVFEEDLDLPRPLIEKLKQSLFQTKVGKDILNARKSLVAKAKTYYSNEALNPRPKRGRPPKQIAKPEIEPQVTIDIYNTVPPSLRPFLYVPDMQTTSQFSAFSTKFDSEEGALGLRRQGIKEEESIQQKLAALRSLTAKWQENQSAKVPVESFDDDFEDEEDEEDDFDEEEVVVKPKLNNKKAIVKAPAKKAAPKPQKSASPPPVKKEPPKAAAPKAILRKVSTTAKPKNKRIIPQKGKTKPPSKGGRR